MEHRNECHNNIKNKQDTQPKEDSFHNSIPDTKQSVSELTRHPLQRRLIPLRRIQVVKESVQSGHNKLNVMLHSVHRIICQSSQDQNH